MRHAIIALAVTLGACATPPGPATLTGPEWRLESIAGAAPARPSTLRFEEGRLMGRGPCNNYGGTWRMEEGRLRAGPLIATRMACPEPAMGQEGMVLRLIETGRIARLTGDRLELLGSDGTRLVARR